MIRHHGPRAALGISTWGHRRGWCGCSPCQRGPATTTTGREKRCWKDHSTELAANTNADTGTLCNCRTNTPANTTQSTTCHWHHTGSCHSGRLTHRMLGVGGEASQGVLVRQGGLDHDVLWGVGITQQYNTHVRRKVSMALQSQHKQQGQHTHGARQH